MVLDDILRIDNKYVLGQHASYTSPATRRFLLMLALLIEAEDVLELGAAGGYTAGVLAQSGAHITTVDLSIDAPTRLLTDFDNVTIVEGDALEFLQAATDESYDLIYVDDDHTSTHVKEEALEIRRVLRRRGLACFHDVFLHDLRPIVDETFYDWERLYLPSYGSENFKPDFGLGVVRRT